jgi:hypothetical protein
MIRVVLGVLCATALAGCSPLGSPAAGGRTVSSGVQQAQSTHEYPSPALATQSAVGGSPDPRRAVATFAGAYVNWTAATVTARMRALAAESVGQARSAMQLAAAETAQDYELRRGGIANSGSVEAVAPLVGKPDQYAVVTRERTTATATTAYQGLQPAWHVAVATVVELHPGQWVVSRWQPEN